jgi:NAD(P)-dependent dehydrogenase (short-subunit alcohol dehydrogenase family)
MKALKGKVAVVTGGGSGIGRALAAACAREGMKIVLADVDEPGMAETARPIGGDVLSVKCDVSKGEQVEALAQRTLERFGAAHLLFNNAGVAAPGPTWTSTLQDWEWTLGINVMGVVHGIRAFVPRMIAQGGEAHIVNTASAAGHLSVPGSSSYCVSKHGVVTLSECLHHELRVAKSAIRVSVLSPAFVPTGIGNSERNRPPELAATNPLAAPYRAWAQRAVDAGKLSAADVARITLDAVKSDTFYIFTHEHTKSAIEVRFADILGGRDPTNPVPHGKTPSEAL